MPLGLRDDIYLAIADGRHIVLDLQRDRYFCLQPTVADTFQRLYMGHATSDRDTRALTRLRDLGILASQCADRPASINVEPPISSALVAEATLSGSWPAALWGIILVLAEMARLKIRPLSSVLHSVSGTDPKPSLSLARPDLIQVVDTFRLAARVFRLRDRCLPYSIALAKILRRRGAPARLVIAVSGRPFAAHSWVQIDREVINDTVEHATGFSPILVI